MFLVAWYPIKCKNLLREKNEEYEIISSGDMSPYFPFPVLQNKWKTRFCNVEDC